MNERMIFDAALAIADPQARRAYIETACAGQPQLMAAIETLLESHDAAGSFLDIPAVEQLQPNPSPTIDRTLDYPPQIDAASDSNSDDEVAISLEFLQPSTKPGSIGMLAHYEVLQVLGQGGFGIVLKAFDEKLHRLVAIKVMNPQMAATSPPRKRFLREARAAAAIRHENVVAVHSVEEQPLPYLVMEYIDGQTLQQKMDSAGPLEASEVLHIGRQIASGLAAAQTMGLIHRDIKPANILLEQGAEQRVKISDFGLARAADDASMTRTGVISGTPMYMAPEQAQGQTLDHRADLFSLGSVLYQMACGRPPFRAANTVAVLRRVVDDTPRPLQEILPEIPDWLVAIVAKLHAKNPEERFQSAKEVADLLARCQSELQLKGEVTCVPRNNLPTPEREAPAEPRASEVARQTTPSTMPQGAPRKLTAKPIVLSLLLGVAMMSPILFGRHFSLAFNKWLWPSIPTLPSTAIATGLRFDGKDDYVRVGPLDLSSPQYTLEAFVTSAKDGDNGVIALLKNVEKTPELMYLYDGFPSGQRQSGAGIIGQRPYQSVNAPLVSGAREHRALVFDGSAMHYYVNGIWQGKRHCTARKGLMWEMRELYIGCKAIETEFFRGQIDQLRLSKIARYNNNFTVASKLTSDDSTLCLYNFDEGHGDTLNDSSGHGHHGKIVGATWASPNSSSNSLSPIESNNSTEPDRRAAEWTLLIGGTITIKENGVERGINAGRDLPDGAFELTGVRTSAGNSKVIDSEMSKFIGCKNLNALHLNDNAISDAGLIHFKNCTHLTLLSLSGTQVSDVGLSYFKDCKSLTLLHLDNTNVTNTGVAYLKENRGLGALHLKNTKVGDAGVAHFKDCKNLAHLHLSGSLVTNAGLDYFKDCKNLVALVLSDTQVSDAGLSYFKNCKNLTYLELSNTTVSDASLERLTEYPKLSELLITKTKVTEAGVKKLAAALPGCKIEWDGGVIEPSLAPDPDRRAAEYVLSIGGTISVKENGQAREIIAVGDLPQGAFELTIVSLNGSPKVSDAGLVQFKNCKNLVDLDLGSTQVSDVGLAYFNDCKKLTHLKLGWAHQVSDAGLIHFKDCKDLTTLVLQGNQVSDAGLAHFQDCKKLTMLFLQGIRVSDAGLAYFKDCQKLTDLALQSTGVTDAGLAHFQACKNITYLNLHGTEMSDAGLAHFKDCKNLYSLWLDSPQVSDAGLGYFKDCANLTWLTLGCAQVTDVGLAQFKDWKNLNGLNLADTQVSDAGLAYFKNCTNLMQVELQSTQISDMGLAQLAATSKLARVIVTRTKVTAAGVKKLSAALPGCKIEWDGGVIEGSQK